MACRTPALLYVAVGGFTANAVLNVTLVYGAGLGIAGSAWGTVIAQNAMAAVYLVVVVRGARQHLSGEAEMQRGLGGRGVTSEERASGTRPRRNRGEALATWWASLRPDAAGIRACARAGLPLLVRTLSLRAVLMTATAVAARLGDADIAAHQITLTLWTLLAMALDAIAIAGQAIIGRYLGAGDPDGARAACRRMVQWGVASGIVMGLLVAAARPLIAPLFTTDPEVRQTLMTVLLVVALAQPVCGWVFILDGVLMGAGDGPYLAGSMLVTLAVFIPAAFAVLALHGGLALLWWSMTLMMLTRLATLQLRAASGKWLVTGSVRA